MVFWPFAISALFTGGITTLLLLGLGLYYIISIAKGKSDSEIENKPEKLSFYYKLIIPPRKFRKICSVLVIITWLCFIIGASVSIITIHMLIYWLIVVFIVIRLILAIIGYNQHTVPEKELA